MTTARTIDESASTAGTAASRGNETKYRSLVEETEDVFCSVDAQGDFTYVSPQAARYGFDPSRVIGTPFLEHVHPEDRERLAKEFLEVVTTGREFRSQFRALTPDGGIVWCEDSVRVKRGPSGEIAELLLVVRDISDCRKTQEALRESEEKLRTVMAAAQDAIVMMNAEGEISLWNSAAERTFGYTAEEVVGRNLHQLLARPIDYAKHLAGFGRFCRSGEGPATGRVVELIALRKGGVEFPIELSVSPVRLGERWHAVGIVRDVTDRKHGEQQLRQHMEEIERFNRLALAREDRVLELKRQVNELARLAGQPPPYDPGHAELEPEPGHEPVASSQDSCKSFAAVEPVEPKLADLIDLGQMQQLLDNLCDAVGISAAIIEPCGRVLVAARWQRICTAFHRANDRSRSRCIHSDTVLARQLREGESLSCYRCRNGLTEAASPIVIDGRHLGDVFVGQLLLEPADEGLFRRQAEEFGFDEGEYLRALRQVPVVPREKLSAILKALRAMARLVASVGLERLRGKTAEQRLAQRADDLNRANGELESQKLNLEAHRQELLASNEQLQWAIQLANDMALQANSANVAKSQFLANVSHEIRTPMMAILGYADLLASGPVDPEHQEAVSTIRRNGDHLLAVINDILDVSRIEAGEIRVEKVACALPSLLADVAELVRIRAHAKGIALKLEYAGPIPQAIVTDPTRLRQILVNLVGNAVKFTETGEVRIVASLAERDTPDPKLQCEVIDTGIGISPGEIERLFQPFHQVDSSTTRKYGGTGLGLTISKRLAVALGGVVTVRSVLGEGSTFTVTLPTGPLAGTALLDRPEPRRPTADAPHPESAAQARLDCRVLLAEDGPDNQRFIATVLRKGGGEVTVVENGQEALEAALATISRPGAGLDDSPAPFDVILRDMQMPVMDGYEATRRLRQAGYRGPIVALTAHAMSEDARKCLDAGCDDYAAKPIDRKRLIALVARHADRRGPEANPIPTQAPLARESLP